MLIKGYYIEAEEVLTNTGDTTLFDLTLTEQLVRTMFDIRDVMSIRQIDELVTDYVVIEIGMGNPRLFKTSYDSIKSIFMNRDSI